MLLSSILQILDRFQAQPQPVQKKETELFEKALAAAMEQEPGPKEAEGAPKEMPTPAAAQTAPAVARQNVEELIRAVTKFEKTEQNLFDVFQ
jgi:hypothetical protein